MGYFALKQLLVTLWGFLFLGFARITVGARFADGVLSSIGSVLVALVVASILWFFAALLVEYGARTSMLRALRACAWFLVSLPLLNAIGHTYLSLKIINSFGPFMLMMIVLALWTARPGENAPLISKSTLLAYVIAYVVLSSLPGFMYAGLLPESRLLYLGNMPLLVADGLVMLIILNRRQRLFRERHQALHVQLLLQQEQAHLDQQYLDDQRKLLTMLAHEMKTPLANLRIWMEAGDRGRPVMERAIQDMNRVIERCVHAGQLSDQSLQPHNEWLDAAELTQTVLMASREPARVRLDVPPDICPVHADAQMLSIALSNLLENAYKYGAPDEPIQLRLEAADGPLGERGWSWQIDNAVGPAGYPDPNRLFEKYYRNSMAKRQSGSGLGLYLVKSLLTLMKGLVHYQRLDRNIRFVIWIPANLTKHHGS